MQLNYVDGRFLRRISKSTLESKQLVFFLCIVTTHMVAKSGIRIRGGSACSVAKCLNLVEN